MLAETASGNPLLRFKKGEFFIGDDEVEVGHEYIAYPFDAMRGFVQWKDDTVVEQRLGRIRDAFILERQDLPEDEDWKPFCHWKIAKRVNLLRSSPAVSAARRRSTI
jgi:hypothetical protein